MRSISLARQISLDSVSLERMLQVRQRDLAGYREQLSTGLRVNRPSDDAPSFSRARKLEVLTNRYDQYERSIVTAQSWVDHTQENLNTLADLFTSAHEEAIQAANDTLSDEDREAIASSLESSLSEILDVLNTKVGDEYLFAGTNTTVRPFEQDGSATADGAGITYYGNDDGRTRAVGPDVDLDVNITGQRILDTGSGFTITEAFQGLIDAVRTNDATQIDTALGDLITARDHILDTATEAGNLANRLGQINDQLGTARIEFESQRSYYEDADVTEVVLDLNRTETSLQATLQMMATIRQNTLLDFIR
ncbi:flagellar hook-associated protein FlgL [Rhodocaloribacter sp.]